MLTVNISSIGKIAIIECEGRIVRSEAAFKLRQAVTSLSDARIIVLDLSKVPVIEGGGLGMLVFLQGWAHCENIRLKLLDPCQSVRDRLKHASSMCEFDIATLDEVTALFGGADGRYAPAA
jgi:anti-anti-sigma regulatory factor